MRPGVRLERYAGRPSRLLQFSVSAPANDQGRFQMGGLAPGDYRVLALTEDILGKYSSNLIPLLSRAETSTGSYSPGAMTCICSRTR